MARRSVRLGLLLGLIVVLHSAAARADVCVTIDTTRDTLLPADRAAALILMGEQLEAEGQHVVTEGCDEFYILTHVRFGDTITVTLSGPKGQRQGVAIGMSDVPALYSQLVRALLNGEAVGSFRKVVDRGNVTVRQADPLRVEADSMTYARLGYGAVFGSESHGVASMGFGIRRELDTFAIDASFFNIQTKAPGAYYASSSTSAVSWVKLAFLHYQNGQANATPYFGGGLSWGMVSSSNGSRFWSGGGLQGELSAGYELMRASNLRVFVQSDVVLPFYSVTSTTYTWPARAGVIEHRYMPSANVSLGLGWSRGSHRYP
jgi:hypothetical protein